MIHAVVGSVDETHPVFIRFRDELMQRRLIVALVGSTALQIVTFSLAQSVLLIRMLWPLSLLDCLIALLHPSTWFSSIVSAVPFVLVNAAVFFLMSPTIALGSRVKTASEFLSQRWALALLCGGVFPFLVTSFLISGWPADKLGQVDFSHLTPPISGFAAYCYYVFLMSESRLTLLTFLNDNQKLSLDRLVAESKFVTKKSVKFFILWMPAWIIFGVPACRFALSKLLSAKSLAPIHVSLAQSVNAVWPSFVAILMVMAAVHLSLRFAGFVLEKGWIFPVMDLDFLPMRVVYLPQALNASSDRYILHLAFHDLYQLSQAPASDSRLKNLFGLSKPGGCPHNWQVVLDACLRQIDHLAGRGEELVRMLNERSTAGLQLKAKVSPNLPPHYQITVTPPAKNVHVANECGTGIYAGFSAPVKAWIMRKCGFIGWLVNESNEQLFFVHVKEPKMYWWAIAALSTLVNRSPEIDPYGIVQRDLDVILAHVLRLYNTWRTVVRLMDPPKKGFALLQRDAAPGAHQIKETAKKLAVLDDVSVRSQLMAAINECVEVVLRDAGDRLQHMKLSGDHEVIINQFLSKA